jgi:hypothetical protein
VLPLVHEIGFDSVTHYVFLPDWKGPFVQDYAEYAELRATQWPAFATNVRVALHAVGGARLGRLAARRRLRQRRPDKYPWWPVVTGEHPEHFGAALRARRIPFAPAIDDPLVLVASLNEWSEGHYLEPDQRFGMGWLEAVAKAHSASQK